MHIRGAFKHLDGLPEELSVKLSPAWNWSPHEAPKGAFILAAADCNMERLNKEATFNDWLGLLGDNISKVTLKSLMPPSKSPRL